MSAAKFIQITAVIEQRIRNHYYTDRLPTTWALAHEFGVARQTITNALRPLCDRGLLTASRKLGIRINTNHQDEGGLIALVTGCDDKMLEQNPFIFQELIDPIYDAGFIPIKVGLPDGYRLRNPARLLKADFAGVLFASSSITLEIALYLEKNHVPFVSQNRLPIYPRLNYVETASFKSLAQVAARVADRGYRKIGLFFLSKLEGYNELIRREWLAIKSQLGLPELSCDHFEYQGRYDPPAYCEDFVDYCMRHEQLDLLIFWTSSLGSLREDYRGTIKFIRSGLPVIMPWQPPGIMECQMPNVIKIKFPDTHKLELAAFEALRELIIAKPSKPIHRFVDFPIEFLDEPPEIGTLRQPILRSENNIQYQRP